MANVRENGGLVVVDYLQKVRIEGSRGGRTEDVDTICRALKDLGRELHVGVATASQFSKRKDGRRASNQDLRESGAIEFEADKLVIVRKLADADGDGRQPSELDVTKNRRGRLGSIHAYFNKRFTRFEEVDERFAFTDEHPLRDETRRGSWWTGD
jgi:replicative DNA helicase